MAGLPFKIALRRAPAMSRRVPRPSYAGFQPSFEQRAQGRPGAGRTHGPRATKSTRQNHRYEPEHPASPAQWLYGLLRALPGDRLFCPRLATTLARCAGISTGMPGPHGLTVRTGLSVGAGRTHAATQCAHRIPHPTSVTTAKRPLKRGGTEGMIHDFWKKERRILRNRSAGMMGLKRQEKAGYGSH
jgi:hypothetical protein